MNKLQVELATVAGISPQAEAAAVLGLGSLADLMVGLFGKDWGLAAHSQSLVIVGVMVLAAAHVIGRAVHAMSIEQANGLVKVASIRAASIAASAVMATSPDALIGTVVPPVEVLAPAEQAMLPAAEVLRQVPAQRGEPGI